jgi:hypothetical protein
MALFLIPAFGITALLYAAIGFGGGSTYTALLAISGTDYRILPVISRLWWRAAHGVLRDQERLTGGGYGRFCCSLFRRHGRAGNCR